jgi:RND family efflux transporter MFP subunit
MITFKPLLAKKMLGTLLVLSFVSSACSSQAPQAVQPQAVPVKIEELETSTLQENSQFVGSLEAQERVTLASRVDGRIVSIDVSEGDKVKQGQIILQLQQTREQEEVNAAVSNVNIQKANLNNAEAELRAAKAEEASAAAAVEQAKADLEEQKAELELAEANLERAKFLVSQGAESKQFLDDRTRDYNAATARQNAISESLNVVNKTLIAAQERVKAAEANVDREQAGLDQAQAQVGVASENLQFNRVVAPINGQVGNIIPKPGDYIEAGDNLTTITQNDTLELNINVPIERSPQLQVGLPVEIIDSEGNTQVEGKISFVAPNVNRTEQAILAKATFPNNGQLKDDQLVRTKIIWSQQPGVLIPTEAVSRIGGQNFVFLAQEEKTDDGQTNLVAKQKTVTLGDIQGQNYQVTSGLQPGDKLIVSGILNLADGVPIATESLTSNKQESN